MVDCMRKIFSTINIETLLKKPRLFFSRESFSLLQKSETCLRRKRKCRKYYNYNSYIDKCSLIKFNNIKKLKFLKVEQKNIDDLVRDLNYLRTTNKIIFDKFFF